MYIDSAEQLRTLYEHPKGGAVDIVLSTIRESPARAGAIYPQKRILQYRFSLTV